MKYLDVSSNAIACLPTGIGRLINLEFFNIASNKLKFYLSKEIGQLSSLKFLLAANNSIEYLPIEISNLQNLQLLDLSKNLIREFPEEIHSLSSLKVLGILRNDFYEIPGVIAGKPGYFFLSKGKYVEESAKEVMDMLFWHELCEDPIIVIF